MEDECLLPQTQAFILETYRWRPVVAGGVAHRATKDIIWVGLHQHPGPVVIFYHLTQRNYCIPAGANVVGNHW